MGSDGRIEIIELALEAWMELRASSRYEDCSDRPLDQITETIFLLANAIQRVAPRESQEYMRTMDAIAEMGPGNPNLLTLLPGILKSLKRRDAEKPLLSENTSDQNDPDRKTVFVIHGRNDTARNSFFTFLRALGLQPLEWHEAVALTGNPAPYIGQILDAAFSRAQAIVVLLTGDDLARLGTRYQQTSDPWYERNLMPQARPNVLFEAGMAIGRQPQRTILVSLGESRPFSDIAGRHTVVLTNSAKQRQILAARLRLAGCSLDLLDKTDWFTAGDFDAAVQTPDIFGAVPTST